MLLRAANGDGRQPWDARRSATDYMAGDGQHSPTAGGNPRWPQIAQAWRVGDGAARNFMSTTIFVLCAGNCFLAALNLAKFLSDPAQEWLCAAAALFSAWSTVASLSFARQMRVFERARAECEQRLAEMHDVIESGQSLSSRFQFLDDQSEAALAEMRRLNEHKFWRLE